VGTGAIKTSYRPAAVAAGERPDRVLPSMRVAPRTSLHLTQRLSACIVLCVAFAQVEAPEGATQSWHTRVGRPDAILVGADDSFLCCAEGKTMYAANPCKHAVYMPHMPLREGRLSTEQQNNCGNESLVLITVCRVRLSGLERLSAEQILAAESTCEVLPPVLKPNMTNIIQAIGQACSFRLVQPAAPTMSLQIAVATWCSIPLPRAMKWTLTCPAALGVAVVMWP